MLQVKPGLLIVYFKSSASLFTSRFLIVCYTIQAYQYWLLTMFSPVILAAPPLLSLLLLLSTSQQVHSKTIINFGILLPNKTANQLVTRDPCSDLDIVIAESSITLASIGALLKWTPNDSAIHLNISYHDSKCSDSFAPFAAMELYYRGTIHALFGPCCKYALSPVGRYAKVWVHISQVHNEVIDWSCYSSIIG